MKPINTSVLKQIIILRTDLEMRKGKMVAQGAHASVKAVMSGLDARREDWVNWIYDWLEDDHFTKIALKCGSEEELLQRWDKVKMIFPTALIRDKGFTTLKVEAYSALAIGPAPNELLDEYFKDMRLL